MQFSEIKKMREPVLMAKYLNLSCSAQQNLEL